MLVTHTRKGRAYSRIARARSQSAMEYLMTYGWAILIIAIVVVALFSLGVFNPSNFAARAQPGLCEVLRSSAVVSLAGQCNGLLPEYVSSFGSVDSHIQLPVKLESEGQTSEQYPSTIVFWFSPKVDPRYSAQTFLTSEDAGVCGNMHITSDGTGNITTSEECYAGGYFNIQQYSLAGKWNMIAVSFGGSTNTQSDYLNGVSQPISGLGTQNINWYDPEIGSGMIGSFANVQLYNTSLDQNSITALYQEGIGGAPIDLQNLVGWWPLNGNVNDYSGNGNDGTPNNVTYTSSWTSGYSAP